MLLAWTLMYLGWVGMPQVLLAFFAPAATAWIAVRLFRRWRIRSARLAVITAGLAVPFLIYSAAVSHVNTLMGVVSKHEAGWVVQVVVSPVAIWHVAGGCWTRVPWVPLSLVILSVFAFVVVPYSAVMMRNLAECEHCRVPIKPQRTWFVPIGNPDRLVQEAENGIFGQLMPGTAPSPESGESWMVTVESCTDCDQLSLLTVTRIQVGRRRGANKATKRTIIDRLVLRPEWAMALVPPPDHPSGLASKR